MTTENLNRIIDHVRLQRNYENKCAKAFNTIFGGNITPAMQNFLYAPLCIAMDLALGIEDFFEWWIFDTECGTNGNSMWIDGIKYPVSNADEILAFAQAYRERNENNEKEVE